ncbi:hypothetical protein BU24DRAFT_234672 [Aaosphaeria arxii CBS 175.79]|uniref:Uncharacterized protein n=1 Tax=Aaosphaeria arxii CBS 175.79 TaxID=1450172 RepID=A0A6A5XKD8_9PLEO|nr:uncharacterized protein BU24DRAFT_234672 [Aaosphaeria arxii CBS 175.79]KAF2013311.1 hypothetical protein BU24DRAFT_234672 [Aaosphaeria arxii CBS 175.79]
MTCRAIVQKRLSFKDLYDIQASPTFEEPLRETYLVRVDCIIPRWIVRAGCLERMTLMLLLFAAASVGLTISRSDIFHVMRRTPYFSSFRVSEIVSALHSSPIILKAFMRRDDPMCCQVSEPLSQHVIKSPHK